MPSRLTLIATGIALSLGAGSVFAQLQTETVEYQVDGESYTGYLAWNDSYEGPRPGVLVVHEWWGHNEFARDQAEKLAAAGYTAFALDMYGSGKLADHPRDAMAFMEAATADLDSVVNRFTAAMNILKQHETVDSNRIAAQVAGFVDSMMKAEADFTVTSFPGVRHSFTNPGADRFAADFDMPVGFDQGAAERSWNGTMQFYQEIFQD